MKAIEFEKVRFSYKTNDSEENNEPFSTEGVFALNGIDFSVEEGEFVAVLGHNGSGKSTLARLINGLLTPSEGKITVFGLDVSDSKQLFNIRKNVGIVFQNPDNQTVASIVEDDVAFGPENIGVPRVEIGERIDFALKAVGMEEYRNGTTSRLSGGQKQRVAIAGVLALKPRIMILDESTAMLDPRGRKEVLDVVLKLKKEENITVLLITHFPEEAMLADRAIVMNRGEIVMQGKPSDILCREEELETYNLTLPKPVKICRDLRRGGFSVKDCLTPEALAREIAEAFSVREITSGETARVEEDGAYSDSSMALGQGGVYCKNLRYVYNPSSPFATHALNGVDIQIRAGEFFGVIGHTGSGKSTFVQHLNALLKTPTAEKKYKPKKLKKGQTPPPPITLTVNGYDLTDKKTDFRELRSKVGMVFQYPEYQLFAETVFADVAFGLNNFSVEPLSEAQIEEAVKEAIETVGLDYNEVKNRSPFELSGGQKRRVAIAGVIVTKPEILVLDEPAAGLDPLGKEEIMRLLHKIHKDWCKTVIIVSHDMDEISENCTRAAVFSEGKVVLNARPQDLFEQYDELSALGLDAPFTAKTVSLLKEKGYFIRSDFTSGDLVDKVLAFASGENRKGGQTNE
ncbi:MAG: energy-coupling factor transporter ATPase [Clostridia bacterium]|nr:energy-coupling factor transporter ATPase [Clostridia bacterium]